MWKSAMITNSILTTRFLKSRHACYITYISCINIVITLHYIMYILVKIIFRNKEHIVLLFTFCFTRKKNLGIKRFFGRNKTSRTIVC